MRAWPLWIGTLMSACATSPNADGIALTHDGERVRVEVHGEPFAEFRTSGSSKPFLYPLYAPGAIPVTRGYPIDGGEERPGEASDHPHHVSLWFAHGDVSGHDFWHGAPKGAFVRTRAVQLDGARILSEHDWDAGERTWARERRTMTFAASADARWIDFDVTLDTLGDRVTFGDTKEGTFALRLAPTLRVEGAVAAGSLLDSEGRVDGEVWGQRARWVAARGPAEGGAVTVAIFDHPANPRHPTWWHARKYGLLAANPFGRHDFEGAPEGAGDLVVEGELRLRYRVWLAAGSKSANELAAAWSAYAGRP
jgi:hypothetical protein